MPLKLFGNVLCLSPLASDVRRRQRPLACSRKRFDTRRRRCAACSDLRTDTCAGACASDRYRSDDRLNDPRRATRRPCTTPNPVEPRSALATGRSITSPTVAATRHSRSTSIVQFCVICSIPKCTAPSPRITARDRVSKHVRPQFGPQRNNNRCICWHFSASRSLNGVPWAQGSLVRIQSPRPLFRSLGGAE